MHPALVLGVYAEDLAHGARTAIFGSATLGLAEELALRGARLVHVYDVDAGRVAEATARSHDRSIFYAPLPDGGDVGVRDGAFDFVLVPDLSLFADPASIVALVRRVVSPLGAALIASPNADAKAPLLPVADPRQALGYYELYETIAAHFESVRMIGQAPFVGYAVAELSVEDPEPTIDSSLAESEGKEPDWFLALASDRNLRLDPFALIELPVQLFSSASLAAAHEDVAVSLASETVPSGPGTVLINVLEAEREAALASLHQQEQTLHAERFRADRAVQELVAAREELDLLRERCRALDERVGEGEARSTALESRLEKTQHDPELATLRERLRSSEERVRALEGSTRASEERVRALEGSARASEERARAVEGSTRASEERARALEGSARASEERARVLEGSARASEERARVLEGAARGVVAEHEAEIAQLESQLRERGREIQELRAEVDRRDKLVRELVMTNFPASASAPLHAVAPAGENGSRDPALVADLSARLDHLASDAARREADLVGARWRIAQLERELTQQR